MDVHAVEFDWSIERNVAVGLPIDAGREHMYVMSGRRKASAKRSGQNRLVRHTDRQVCNLA